MGRRVGLRSQMSLLRPDASVVRSGSILSVSNDVDLARNEPVLLFAIFAIFAVFAIFPVFHRQVLDLTCLLEKIGWLLSIYSVRIELLDIPPGCYNTPSV